MDRRLVCENVDYIKDLFSNLEEQFLDNYIRIHKDKDVDVLIHRLLESNQVIPKKVQQEGGLNASQLDNDKTLNFSDELEDDPDDADTDIIYAGTFERPTINDPGLRAALAKLVDFVRQETQKPPEVVNNAFDRHDLVQFASEIFTRTRITAIRPFFNKNEIKMTSHLVTLFFIDNGLTGTEAFTLIKEHYISQGLQFAIRDLHQLKNRRNKNYTDTDHDQHNPATIRKDLMKGVLDRACQFVEDKLVELATAAPNAFTGIYWKTIPLKELIPRPGPSKEKVDVELFDCIVCYSQFPITKGFQCSKFDFNDPASNKEQGQQDPELVHRFCLDCVRGQAEASVNEALLAAGGLGISCLATGCRNPIIFNSIRLYLPRPLRHRLEKRITSQAICSAGLDNLEHCIKCDFVMEMDVPPEINKVFECRRCTYSFCRICEIDWSKHFGKSCQELENAVTKQRQLETKMNEAVIRTCPRCHLQFVKLSACNKMVCRCGLTMCYICRKTQIDYDHFCRHFRDPNFPNAKCKECPQTCLLWDDFRKHDEAELQRLVKQSQQANLP